MTSQKPKKQDSIEITSPRGAQMKLIGDNLESLVKKTQTWSINIVYNGIMLNSFH